MKDPKVSIVMAAYNATPFLTEALDDLLAQSFTDFELIVVDDGSIDGTLATLDAYAAVDPRLVILRSKANQGLPTALNRGIEHARAALIARADADDRYPLDRLARQVEFMDAHPEIGLLSGAVDKIDEDGNYLLTVRFPTEDGPIRMRELFLNSFTHPGVMYRTELVRAIGGYDPDYLTSQDADLYTRLRPITRAANLEAQVVYYRKHGSASTQNRQSSQAALALGVRQRLLSEYLQRPVDIEEAEALQTVFWRRQRPTATLAQFMRGQRGFVEILEKGKLREDADTLQYFRSEVSQTLWAHARFNKNLSSLRRARLSLEAFLWAPRIAASAMQAKAKKVPGKLLRLTRKPVPHMDRSPP